MDLLQWRWESVVLGSGFLFFLLITRYFVSPLLLSINIVLTVLLIYNHSLYFYNIFFSLWFTSYYAFLLDKIPLRLQSVRSI
jgi:hypothetical protein